MARRRQDDEVEDSYSPFGIGDGQGPIDEHRDPHEFDESVEGMGLPGPLDDGSSVDEGYIPPMPARLESSSKPQKEYASPPQARSFARSVLRDLERWKINNSHTVTGKIEVVGRAGSSSSHLYIAQTVVHGQHFTYRDSRGTFSVDSAVQSARESEEDLLEYAAEGVKALALAFCEEGESFGYLGSASGNDVFVSSLEKE